MQWKKSKKPGAPAKPQAQRAPASRSGIRPPVQQPKKSLPQLLLEEGKVSREQLERLMEKQKQTGAFIGELIVEEGLIEEQSLISFLAKYCKIPHLSLLDYLIDPEIIQLIPKEVCLEYRLLPIDKLGNNLTVAMVNPLDAKALDKVRNLCPNLRIKPILCAYRHFETVTAKAFGETRSTKGAVEMSASSFGLHIPKTPAAEAPPAQETAGEATTPEPAEEAPPVPPADTVTNLEATPPAGVSEEPPYEAAPAEARAKQASKINSDALVDDVFQATGGGTPDRDSSPDDMLGGMMEEMASVMMDSMRDTYDMLARRMELFHGLKPDDVAKIFARGDTIEVQAGQTIFEKGQPGDNMYIILGGGVRIFDGDREIAELKRGDMFGEMALVSSEPRSASAAATESSSLLALNIDVIRDVMPRDVSVQLLINIVVTLSDRLRNANEN